MNEDRYTSNNNENNPFAWHTKVLGGQGTPSIVVLNSVNCFFNCKANNKNVQLKSFFLYIGNGMVFEARL